MPLLVLVIVLMAQSHALAQITFGARSTGLNYAVTALPENQWAVYANPAFMPDNDHTASFYYIRYFGLSELSDVSAVVSYPFHVGTLGVGVHSYGFDKYRESDLQLAYRYIYRSFRAAVRVHGNHVSFGGHYSGNNATVFGVDLGLGAQLFKTLWFGAVATNLNRPKYADDSELPRSLSLGTVYQPNKIWLITMDIYKELTFPIALRGGIEVHPVKPLALRFGAGTAPATYTMGVGFNMAKWSANVAVHHHQQLGWSPGIDFGYTW